MRARPPTEREGHGSSEYYSERELRAWGQEPTKADRVRISMSNPKDKKHGKVGHILGPMNGRQGYPITTADGEVYHAQRRNVMISPVKKRRPRAAAVAEEVDDRNGLKLRCQ